MKESYRESFVFEPFCRLPQNLLVRRNTDAMKLKNLQNFVAFKKYFFLKDTVSQKNENSTNSFLSIENNVIFVEFKVKR